MKEPILLIADTTHSMFIGTIMITQSRLKEVLVYDQETGIFTWLKNLAHTPRKGCIAGTKRKDGYLTIKIDTHHYLSHRLAWLYVYGNLNCKYLDHINGIKNDNRISNLRTANSRNNKHNEGIRKNNTSGYRGVSFSKCAGRWTAKITTENGVKHLGCFANAYEASIAYEKEAKIIHGVFYKALDNLKG